MRWVIEREFDFAGDWGAIKRQAHEAALVMVPALATEANRPYVDDDITVTVHIPSDMHGIYSSTRQHRVGVTIEVDL